jgi:hypothetical protein
MRQEKYIRAVLEKLEADNSITCEDCGNRDKLGHFIIEHQAETVRAVCHTCFVTKYQNALYGKGHKA